MLVAGTLFLPNYPALHYYFYQKVMLSNADVTIQNSHNLLSDYRYLSAITERASDVVNTKSDKPEPPPKPHKEISGFVYLLSGSDFQLEIENIHIKYFIYQEFYKNRCLPVQNPPPVV